MTEVALIVVELITNAAKYAYQGKPGGTIWVCLTRAGDNEVIVSMRDRGLGLPEDFNVTEAKSLGMRIIASFSKQLGARLTIKRDVPGSEFRLSIPLRP